MTTIASTESVASVTRAKAVVPLEELLRKGQAKMAKLLEKQAIREFLAEMLGTFILIVSKPFLHLRVCIDVVQTWYLLCASFTNARRESNYFKTKEEQHHFCAFFGSRVN